jgi:exonuclease SbcC
LSSSIVPVRLELQNFLGFGTEAPPLDFEQFDVACLSGGNGEGKSALLDAMTWALWGEARKSSGKRKPDDELIRIGSRHMEVTLTFDLEASRYRVTRSFSRSATGKTTSSDLEFQLYDPGKDTYRPLTGSTQRETQGRIEDTLGLDYDTFINSAFLLQGRSDEFTNKSPSQRKEILVSILNLSRYEALEERARDRWREAKQRQQRIEAEVERLATTLEDVPEWREQREEVQSELAAKQDSLNELRDREKKLTQEYANLEAKAREIESAETSIEELTNRIEELENEQESLERRIAEAEDLLDKTDEIEATYDRFQRLEEEREVLEEERERHRAVEKRLQEAKSTLQERTNDLERRLDRLKVERKGLTETLEECEAKLENRPAIEERLRTAQAARQQFREQAATRRRRQRLDAQQQEARQALIGLRQQLRGELESLQERIEEEREAVAALEEVENRIADLNERKEEQERLERKLKEIESKGKKVAEQIQEQSGQLEARREERARAVEELHRFRAAEGPRCPTCGTDLTPLHRDEVEETLQKSIDELEEAIDQREQTLEALEERRTKLRKTYVDLQSKRKELEGVAEELATAREQRRTLKQQADALETHAEKADRLQTLLEEGTYGQEHRRRWQWCAQRKAEQHVDPDHYEALQSRAAQLDRYAEQLQELNETEDRRHDLREQLNEKEEEIEEIQEALQDGSPFEELHSRIEELEEQLEETNFDPDLFKEVRAALDELSDAQDRKNALQRARENHDDWSEQLEQNAERLAALREDREAEQERMERLREEVEGKEALEQEIREVESEIEAMENEINDAQQTLGMLNERLDQAQRDQEALEEARDDLEECKTNRHLYNHLRTAFGKHGIPSLIIEETLPEIEERANGILERLTDGRMHVRLETLKEKKSGGTKETLDIIITDEQGVARPYETYSGGESFRVNFALRVALAQLLAERSGVRVRTLVIDEGFGTQDEDGIERLVEAIQSIREDFAKILVITHLPRLKEAFPVRIEVEKDPVVGSTFELVGA